MSKELSKNTHHTGVLVSGGIESSVLLWDALQRSETVTPFYVKNHLRWEEAEIFWLKSFHRNIKSSKLQPIRMIDMPMRDIYDRHWSITGIKVPGPKSKDESMYLPGRNIVLLAKVACVAAMSHISSLEIGVLKGNPFKDSSKAFFKKMEEVLSVGLDSPIQIRAPFQTMKKDEVLILGKHLPLELTFSCVNPKGFEHCGDCNKCTERKKAFFSSGLVDKTRYKKIGI